MEVETGWIISRRWSTYVSYTHSVAGGNNVPGICEQRVTMDAAHRF